ncbi:hypothetical protein BaRGS_00013188 [Batillaria attramentaria]|uniref:Uncharacterized protein n=1 Tax=Batillaria attramentaria TaxID=370345 RepID=A0ABD0L8I9_9CAEN
MDCGRQLTSVSQCTTGRGRLNNDLGLALHNSHGGRVLSTIYRQVQFKFQPPAARLTVTHTGRREGAGGSGETRVAETMALEADREPVFGNSTQTKLAGHPPLNAPHPSPSPRYLAV